MNPRLFIRALLTIGLAALPAAGSAAPAAPPASSEQSVSASRWVTAWAPPDAPPANVAYFAWRLTSPETLDAVATELGIPAEARRFYRPQLEGPSWGQDMHSAGLTFKLQLPADNPSVPKKAGPFLDALVERLQQWLAEPDRQTQAEAEKGLNMARDEAGAMTARLAQLRNKLREVTGGRADVTPEGIRTAAASLEQERQRRELQLAAAQARRQALQEAVGQSSKRAQTRLNDDEIARQLQKVVEFREAELKRTQELYSKAAIARSELSEAEAKVAEAKTNLLLRQEAVAGGAASGAADKLVQQMEAEALSVVESEAVLDHVRAELKKLSDASPLLDEYERLQSERDRARAGEAAAQARVELARRGGRHPVVVVMGVEDRNTGDPAPAKAPAAPAPQNGQ